MAITRNRYGKHMQAILAIVAQAPGEWHTLATDVLVRNAARRLERKGVIQLTEDGSEARYVVPQGHANVSAPTGQPDGWVVKEKDNDVPKVITDEQLVKGLLALGYVITARPFRYTGEAYGREG